MIKTIQKIKSKNLYYIERKIFKLLESNKNIDFNLVQQILDYLDYKSEELNQDTKYKKLNDLLVNYLD